MPVANRVAEHSDLGIRKYTSKKVSCRKLHRFLGLYDGAIAEWSERLRLTTGWIALRDQRWNSYDGLYVEGLREA